MAAKRGKQDDRHKGVQVKFYAPEHELEAWKRAYPARGLPSLSSYLRALANGFITAERAKEQKQ